MAGSDVRDILELEDSSQKRPIINKETLLAKSEKKKTIKQGGSIKRPENIPREVWDLHADKGGLPSLMPTEQGPAYKQGRAMNALGRVRSWKWTTFKNSAREDGVLFSHWRRASDESKDEDYSFAKFNKKPELPSFTDEEYKKHLTDSSWTQPETTYLLDQCRRFDLRFVIVHDRWDSETYTKRSLEDIKERYYQVLAIMDKVHGTNLTQGFVYDAAHERRRREQLVRLHARTPEQVEEEKILIAELKKIELRKKEREKKTQDLQKLISQADSLSGSREAASALDARGGDRKSSAAGGWTPGMRKRPLGAQTLPGPPWDGLKFPDITKNPGVVLRSQKLKLPSNLGQKKSKIIETFLEYFQIDPNPPPTEEIVEAFNELRSDVLMLYDLRSACNHCDYELQSMRLKFQQLAPGKPLPPCLQPTSTPPGPIDSGLQTALRAADAKRPKFIGQPNLQSAPGVAGMHASRSHPTLSDLSTPTRKKRAAALGPGQILKRLNKFKSHHKFT